MITGLTHDERGFMLPPPGFRDFNYKNSKAYEWGYSKAFHAWDYSLSSKLELCKRRAQMFKTVVKTRIDTWAYSRGLQDGKREREVMLQHKMGDLYFKDYR